MPRVWLSGTRLRASERAVAGVVQTYTGLPLHEAVRLVERARDGEEVPVELDDEYAAYDLAGLLSDFGLRAEVDESH